MTAPISAWKSHAWIARQLEFVPGLRLFSISVRIVAEISSREFGRATDTLST